MASEFITGIKECQAALVAMDKQVEVATGLAAKKAAATAKTAIKGSMRGRPRWDRRGNGPGGPALNLDLSPHHVSKGGSVGKFSGALNRAIKASRKPRVTPEGASAVTFVGGARATPQINWYKGRDEAKYHYFANGVNKTKPKLEGIFTAAWAKATKT